MSTRTRSCSPAYTRPRAHGGGDGVCREARARDVVGESVSLTHPAPTPTDANTNPRPRSMRSGQLDRSLAVQEQDHIRDRRRGDPWLFMTAVCPQSMPHGTVEPIDWVILARD